MRFIIIRLSALLLLLASCAIDKKEDKIDKFETIKTKIDSLGNRYLELGRFSGTIILADKDTVLYHKSFGLADYENNIKFSDKTAFKIGELSQLITNDIFQRLIDMGKLKSSESILQYTEGKTSKLKIQELIEDSTLIDYNVLGHIIENATGINFQSHIQEYSERLTLENTFFDGKNANVAKGYLFQNTTGNGLELIPAKEYDLSEAFSNSGIKSTALDMLKVLRSKDRKVEKEGYIEDDGFSYSVKSNIDDRYFIVILSNRRQPVAQEMTISLESILRGRNYTLPLPRKPFEIDRQKLKDFTGTYALNENVQFQVIQENDSLFVILGPQKVKIIPQSENQFYMKDRDAAMRFLRDSQSQVYKVKLLDGFIDSDQVALKLK